MGRPLGALRGRTEQANELAVWLRKVTLGKAVRTLEEDFAYSTTSWSEFRSGSRLPPEELIKAMVERYVTDPQMRERQETKGLDLLAAARAAEAAPGDTTTPAPAPLPAPVPSPRSADVVTQALLRLDDARLLQIDALQKLAASERRREKLEDMVSVLQERCTVLEVERDRAREDVRAELENELQISREYRRQADEKLEHARRAEEKAYQLRLAAEQQVARERTALNHIDEETADGAPDSQAAGPSNLGLPPLEQIHDVLQAAQEQLEAQDDELDDLEELIGLDPAPQDDAPTTWPAPPIVPEQPEDFPGQDLLPEQEEPEDPQVEPDQVEPGQAPLQNPSVRTEEIPESAREALGGLDQALGSPVYIRPEPFDVMPTDLPLDAEDLDDSPELDPLDDLAEPWRDDDGRDPQSFEITSVPESDARAQPPKAEKALMGLQQLAEAATAPEDLGVALQQLRQRAGGLATWPRTRLSDLFSDVGDRTWANMAVSLWFEGREVPGDWNHLERILTNLGATHLEISAFATAHEKISSTHPPELLRALDPARARAAVAAVARSRRMPMVPLPQPLPRPAPLRLRDMAAPAFSIAFTALVATSWFAALHADPGPATWKLTVYALGAAVLALLTWFAAFVITVEQQKKHHRAGPQTVALVGPPIALVLAAAAPFVGLDAVGEWAASLVALM